MLARRIVACAPPWIPVLPARTVTSLIASAPAPVVAALMPIELETALVSTVRCDNVTPTPLAAIPVPLVPMVIVQLLLVTEPPLMNTHAWPPLSTRSSATSPALPCSATPVVFVARMSRWLTCVPCPWYSSIGKPVDWGWLPVMTGRARVGSPISVIACWIRKLCVVAS
jgi:hypothetical protein